MINTKKDMIERIEANGEDIKEYLEDLAEDNELTDYGSNKYCYFDAIELFHALDANPISVESKFLQSDAVLIGGGCIIEKIGRDSDGNIELLLSDGRQKLGRKYITIFFSDDCNIGVLSSGDSICFIAKGGHRIVSSSESIYMECVDLYLCDESCKVFIYKCGLSYHPSYDIIDKELYDEYCHTHITEMKEIPSENNSGCYIATCVYGSYDCPQVWTLRRYRDYTLSTSLFGRAFIRIYYAISPTLVKWFGSKKWFQLFWKCNLDKMIKRLNDMGVSDSRYDDKRW